MAKNKLYHINTNTLTVYECRKNKDDKCKYRGLGNPYNSKAEAENALYDLLIKRDSIIESMKEDDNHKKELVSKLLKNAHNEKDKLALGEILKQVTVADSLQDCSICGGRLYEEGYNYTIEHSFCPSCGTKNVKYYDNKIKELYREYLDNLDK